MKYFLTLFLISSLLFPLAMTEAATQYSSGKKGGCYMMVKSKQSGKLYKKYVDAKFCKLLKK